MEYCMDCGTRLVPRTHGEEGVIPYCPNCGKYRYPVFNTAVSMIVLNPARDRVLLIQQYGRPAFILVAGYVNRGEDAEDAVVREIREELGAEAADVSFNHSRFFPPSNTLMLNFTAALTAEELHPNREIDSCAWYTFDEARRQIKSGSLAEAFLTGFLDGSYHWPQL